MKDKLKWLCLNGIAVAVVVAFVIAANMGLLAFSVWIVVKVLQGMGVL